MVHRNFFENWKDFLYLGLDSWLWIQRQELHLLLSHTPETRLFDQIRLALTLAPLGLRVALRMHLEIITHLFLFNFLKSLLCCQ